MARHSSNVLTLAKNRGVATPPAAAKGQRRAAKAAAVKTAAKVADEGKPRSNNMKGRPKGGRNQRPPRPHDCRYLTVKEFAEYYRMCLSTARNRAKKLTRLKHGNIVLIPVEEAERLMRSYLVPPNPAPPKRDEARTTP